MSQFARRKVLQVCGVALGVVGAGCSTFQTNTTETRIGEITVINQVAQSDTVHLLLIEDSNPIYWDSIEVEPNSGREGVVESKSVQNYPTEPGKYALYAWLDDQSRSEWEQVDLTESDSSCLDITIMVDSAENERDGLIRILTFSECADDGTENF
ncbi:hypothetical protein [Natrinema longum]|uniref:Uncharacterized protein n=1 Tax=Natrinema longum TaxID=370324 RepID=A0A8A2UG48_9EURY|nr:hypothetical protein [Natrinema longum]MBZ6495547.1 hypothetical protein [Natrinema longum]QSW86488.1 hypothetical protein J0X27_06630 [Natrinema longum]